VVPRIALPSPYGAADFGTHDPSGTFVMPAAHVSLPSWQSGRGANVWPALQHSTFSGSLPHVVKQQTRRLPPQLYLFVPTEPVPTLHSEAALQLPPPMAHGMEETLESPDAWVLSLSSAGALPNTPHDAVRSSAAEKAAWKIPIRVFMTTALPR
jgi:hypothetical protein